jgi:hypothetical protein
MNFQAGDDRLHQRLFTGLTVTSRGVRMQCRPGDRSFAPATNTICPGIEPDKRRSNLIEAGITPKGQERIELWKRKPAGHYLGTVQIYIVLRSHVIEEIGEDCAPHYTLALPHLILQADRFS